MMKRLQTAVIDMHPDLVIWQVGTNAVLRNLDPARDRQARRRRHRAHSGRGRRRRAGRSAIFAAGQRARRKRRQDDEAARTRSPSCARSASSRASR